MLLLRSRIRDSICLFSINDFHEKEKIFILAAGTFGSGNIGISISLMWKVVPCAHPCLASSLQSRCVAMIYILHMNVGQSGGSLVGERFRILAPRLKLPNYKKINFEGHPKLMNHSIRKGVWSNQFNSMKPICSLFIKPMLLAKSCLLKNKSHFWNRVVHSYAKNKFGMRMFFFLFKKCD